MGSEQPNATLYLDPNHPSMARLSENPKGLPESVAIDTIDNFCQSHRISAIDILKIDTEGHDLSVLKGARNALCERKIGMIQFEFIPANIATGATMHGFFEVLQGYRISRLCLNGTLRSLEPYDVKRCEIYVTHNLIAMPIEGNP